ncbi:hypothetical protein F5I97DRAFT_1929141 [Phlebopus sp. FC_14]|nr:hypothetical protein F5I97DRAFT_1929141 [Phlebopus sp. FC_14]
MAAICNHQWYQPANDSLPYAPTLPTSPAPIQTILTMLSKEGKGKGKAMPEDIDQGNKAATTKRARFQSHTCSKVHTSPLPSSTKSITIVIPLLKKLRTEKNAATGPSQPKSKLSSKRRYIMDFVAVPLPSQKFTRETSTPSTPAVTSSPSYSSFP